MQALSQVRFQPGACRGDRLHLRVEEAHGIAARRLGAIHRQISALYDVVHCIQLALEQGDTEAGGTVVFITIQLVGNVQRIEDLLANGLGLDGRFRWVLTQAFQQDHELISAQPGHCVALAYAAGEAQSDLPQQHVAPVMPQRIVQHLEVIQVDEYDRARMQAAGAGRQHVLQSVQHEPPVGQPGQLIVEGQALHLLLGDLAVGDVGIDRENGLRLAIIVAHQGTVAFERDAAAILAPERDLTRPIPRLYQAIGGRIESGMPLVDQFLRRLAERLFPRQAVKTLSTLVPVQDAVIHAVNDNGVLGLVQQGCLLTGLLLAFAQHHQITFPFGCLRLHFAPDPATVDKGCTDHHQHEHHDRVLDPAQFFDRRQLLLQELALNQANAFPHSAKRAEQLGKLPVHGRHALAGGIRLTVPEEGEDQHGFLHHLDHVGVDRSHFILQCNTEGLYIGAVPALIVNPGLQLLPGHRQMFVELLQGLIHVPRFGFDIMGIEDVVTRRIDLGCQIAQRRVARQLLDPGLVGLDGTVVGIDDQVIQQHAQHNNQYIEPRKKEVHAMPFGARLI
ncbi:hypothetical protein D3C85_781630 [compost metagenome]